MSECKACNGSGWDQPNNEMDDKVCQSCFGDGCETHPAMSALIQQVETSERYEQKGQVLPKHLIESLQRYANDHIETGSFLRAALENDFKGAATLCDYISQNCLSALAIYIVNEMPDECQGSKEKVKLWLSE